MNIGKTKLAFGLMLAPMAGFSDRAMRTLCHRYGAEYTVTEMVTGVDLVRAQILVAEGQRESAILVAQGEKESAVLRAEAVSETSSSASRPRYRSANRKATPTTISITATVM